MKLRQDYIPDFWMDDSGVHCLWRGQKKYKNPVIGIAGLQQSQSTVNVLNIEIHH